MPRRKVLTGPPAPRLARRHDRLPPAVRQAQASGWTSTSRTARWSRSTTARPRRRPCSRSPARIIETARRSGRRRAHRGDPRASPYLEGDFVLRSGKRSTYYLDKYRFETVPELLEPIGARLAAKAAELEPDAQRLACPELGAVTLAAAASLASRQAVCDRPRQGEGVRNRQPARGRLRGRRSCRFDRRRRHIGRCSRRCRPRQYGKLPWNAARPSASSTGKRAEWTPLRVSACACIHCFVRRKSSRAENPKSRMVERKPCQHPVSSRCPTSPEEES